MPHLTISVMIQEDRFALYMKTRGAEAFSTGLLGRMLVAYSTIIDRPGELPNTWDRPEPKLDVFNQRAEDILNQPMPAPRERLTLRLSEEATRYWGWFKSWVHDNLICGDFSEDMKSFFRKIGQNATRLAASLHYFGGADGDITADAMKSAIIVRHFFVCPNGPIVMVLP
ncbi:DUF3987 domain-containing protein [Herbaspirillum sp. RTI4]|uniref:DUF3987 domain-containing protein n=1 Tax=Herbaspirillum sp. RTI4 TaxID=3048640 RepID=UPI002AB3EC1B|nr:DUF3987 domain-containing protein [Herbaspirillum sp. RTI4]MDY7576723.1 DUF3987 domain-containing protein [Herbaspirillum sp. RTI4]MEA9983550.1 DUF3987 domain-containing protein [Herbaspirillum sp. RTI4]